MATIYKEFSVAVPAEQVWNAVRDFGAVHLRLTPGLTISTRLEAGARIVTFANGLVLTELLVGCDDNARRLAYASIKGRARHHNASLQVLPEGKASRVIWITDVLPDELEPQIRALVEQGSALMTQTLEASVAPG